MRCLVFVSILSVLHVHEHIAFHMTETFCHVDIDVDIDVAKTKALICAFVFAYADCWFSHAAAQIYALKRDKAT